MKLQVKRIRAEYPALKIPRAVMDEVGRIAEGNILDNIRTQRQADGAALKSNRPSTMERKRRQGKPALSLVDELHRFVQGNRQSWRWRASARGERGMMVLEPATADLTRLVRIVQRKGYTGWFAISKSGEAAIRKVFRVWVRREFDKAAARSRGRR